MIRIVMLLSLILARGLLPAAGISQSAPSLTVVLPESLVPISASASALKLDTAGKVRGREIVFDNLLPDTPYEISITLRDGTHLQGVDMSWYNEEPSRSPGKPFTEDDLRQINALARDIRSFYDRTDYLQLVGDHDRAVALARLVRDSDFHAGKGNIIWRIELWYLKNQFGGWEKIQQQNKVLRRERYTDPAAYRDATKNLRYVPELGGIRLKAAEGPRIITLPAGVGTTRPAATTLPGD